MSDLLFDESPALLTKPADATAALLAPPVQQDEAVANGLASDRMALIHSPDTTSPYINGNGDLVIPTHSDVRYHHWKPNAPMSLWQILNELNAPAEVRAKYWRDDYEQPKP